jgi:S-adenosylmethionine synthetase
MGLVAPDRFSEGPHAGLADVKHVFSHAQGTGVVLHHAVDKAQVVAGTGGA